MRAGKPSKGAKGFVAPAFEICWGMLRVACRRANLRLAAQARVGFNSGLASSSRLGWGVWIPASDCMDFAEALPGTRGAPKDELWTGEPFPENGVIEPDDAPGFGVSLNGGLVGSG